MEVSIEKVSHLERKLTIVVPEDQVTAAYDKEIQALVSRADIKGFRPGKAPRGVVESRFGGAARQEALSHVMQIAFHEAIRTHGLQPINTPHIEAKPLLAGQPLQFTASFEVLPELPKLKLNLEHIEKPVAEVKEEDIERVIASLQKQHTKWHAVQRGAGEHDRVVISYRMLVADEKEEVASEQVPLELGSKTMLPGFEEGLLGAKADEKRTLRLTFPSDWHDKQRAGKAIECHIEVKSVYEPEIPAVDAQFAKQLGIQSGAVDDLKSQIRESLTQECHRLVQEKLKEQVFGQLIEQNPIEVPASLVMREAGRMHHEMHQHSGACDHGEQELSPFKAIAQKRVALSLLISGYAKEMQLIPDQARVMKQVEELAFAYENPEEVKAWLLSQKEYRSNIEARVLEEMVLEKLMVEIPVKEKPMSYVELKGIR